MQIRSCLHKIYVLKASSLLHRNHAYIALEFSYSIGGYRSDQSEAHFSESRALQKALEDIIRAVAVVVYRLWVILLDAHRTKFKTWKGNFSAAHASAMDLFERLENLGQLGTVTQWHWYLTLWWNSQERSGLHKERWLLIHSFAWFLNLKTFIQQVKSAGSKASKASKSCAPLRSKRYDAQN